MKKKKIDWAKIRRFCWKAAIIFLVIMLISGVFGFIAISSSSGFLYIISAFTSNISEKIFYFFLVVGIILKIIDWIKTK